METIRVQYLAIDPSTQPSMSSSGARYLGDLISGSLADGYGVACSRDPTAVLERAHRGGSLSPQMRSFASAQRQPPK